MQEKDAQKRGRLISNYEAVFILNLVVNVLWCLEAITITFLNY
jgi:hypothetical protein